MPACPDYADVFMPPVNMDNYRHLSFVLVDPPAHNQASLICRALLHQGGNPRVTLAPSSRSSQLIVAELAAALDDLFHRGPLQEQEHTIFLERHSETDARFHFDHEALVSVTIIDFPLVHWRRPHIVHSFAPVANPHFLDPVCITGMDYSAVIVTL